MAWNAAFTGAIGKCQNGVSTCVAYDGTNPHISVWLYDVFGTTELRYVTKLGGYWQPSELIDATVPPTSTTYKFNAIAIDPVLSEPHIVWWNGDALINHSWKSGGVWTTESVSATSTSLPFQFETYGVSIAFDTTGIPHVVWCDPNAGAPSIYYSVKVGGVWSVAEQVDTVVTGGYPSISIDGSDKPHVFYCRRPIFQASKHADRTTGVWVLETVDTDVNQQTCYSPHQMVIDSGGTIHTCNIIGAGVRAGYVSYASKYGGSWHVADAGYGNGSFEVSIGVDASLNPHIFTSNQNAGVTYHMSRSGASWSTENLTFLGYNGDIIGNPLALVYTGVGPGGIGVPNGIYYTAYGTAQPPTWHRAGCNSQGTGRISLGSQNILYINALTNDFIEADPSDGSISLDVNPSPITPALSESEISAVNDGNIVGAISTNGVSAGLAIKVRKSDGGVSWTWNTSDSSDLYGFSTDAAGDFYLTMFDWDTPLNPEYIVSLDSAGALRWTVPLSGAYAFFSGQVPYTPPLDACTYVNAGGSAYAISKYDGSILWGPVDLTYYGTPGVSLIPISPTPSADGRTIYFMEYNFAETPFSSVLTALDACTGYFVWQTELTDDEFYPFAPVLDTAGNIYVGAGRSPPGTVTLSCIEPVGGTVTWTLDLTPTGVGKIQYLATYGTDTIYVFTNKYIVKVKNFGVLGGVVWTTPKDFGWGFGNRYTSVVSLDGTGIYVINKTAPKSVDAVSAADGSVAWSIAYDPQSIALIGQGGLPPGVVGNFAVVYGYCLDPVTGLGGGGSGEPISGAVVTIGGQVPAVANAAGFYSVYCSSDFNTPGTPITAWAPHMITIESALEVPVNTSTEVIFFMSPSFSAGSGSGGGSRVRRSGGTFRNPLNMLKGMKLKIK